VKSDTSYITSWIFHIIAIASKGFQLERYLRLKC